MTTATLLAAAALWVTPSFFLHIGIHEGSHALAAKVQGARVTEFKPWPHLRGGRLVFGACSYYAPVGFSVRAFDFAPAVGELLWATAAATALRHTEAEWLRGVLLVELLASAIDVAWWALSYARPGGDLHRYRADAPALLVTVPVGALIAWWGLSRG